jgi:hypothetical protein
LLFHHKGIHKALSIPSLEPRMLQLSHAVTV